MSKYLPLVTAIITTYRRQPDIVERAINSIINQTYKNIEIIVVDDSPSTYERRNDVRRLVESYDKSIIYIQHEKNMGACVARNTGLRMAMGEFVAYLDDDDEWMDTKIEKQLACFTNGDIALVYCGRVIKEDSTGRIRKTKCIYCEGNVYEKLLEQENFIGSTSYPMLRKKYLEEIGGFDPLMKSSQDVDVWLRLAKKYKVSCVREPLVFYHVHKGERISTNPNNIIEGRNRLREKNKEYINSNSFLRWKYEMMVVPFYARSGQIKKAFSKWGCAIIICPYKCCSNTRYLYRIIKGSMRYLWNNYENKCLKEYF